jgi:hypothetical protein
MITFLTNPVLRCRGLASARAQNTGSQKVIYVFCWHL